MKETEAPAATDGTALRSLLGDATNLAADFLEGLPERRVTPTATAAELRAEFGGPLPEGPQDPRRVISELAGGVEPGLMATPEEVARTVAFLATEAPDFMTGAIVDVNGASYLRS